MIDNIVEVVRKMFFFYVYDQDTIDDLKQEGYLMAYELLAKGEYDPSKNLRNYLFTGVRNAMTNYMYKRNKTKNDISHETLDNAQWQDFMKVGQDDYYVGKVYTRVEYQEDFSFTEKDIQVVAEKYNNFGKDIVKKSTYKLAKKLLVKTNVEKVDTEEELPLVYDVIMGEVVWRKIMSMR